MSTEEKELEVTSTEAPKKPARKPRKPVDPAVWEELKGMQESGEVLTVKINGAVNAGVISYVKGVRGFIPASLLSIAYVEDLNEWVDKSIEVKVITVDPEEKRLVLSGKAVEQEKAACWLAEQLGVKENAKVICVKRVRMANEIPVIFEKDYFSEEHEYILNVDMENVPVRESIVKNTGYEVQRYQDTFDVHFADKEEGEWLLCPAHTA